MIISTNITRNKKPAQATYQMDCPEQLVQNEPTVDSEVLLADEDYNPDLELVPVAEENDQTKTSEVVEEATTETAPVQEQPSEPEPQPVQEPEQPQEEQVEETSKKKASSKKK